jgi:RNA polymerase sigma-70 factor (ECF subfamily)
MKGWSPTRHSPSAVASTTETPRSSAGAGRALDVRGVSEAHAQFVWVSLQRLGIREADLPDVLQEVFVVVHQRLATFEGNSALTTWLFGISMRVAANHRRRAHVRREQPVADVPDSQQDEALGPERAAERAQAADLLRAALDAMDLEKRAVFVMFEIEELSCAEIAAVLGVPVGTVYSRLHAARKQFEALVEGQRGERER